MTDFRPAIRRALGQPQQGKWFWKLLLLGPAGSEVPTQNRKKVEARVQLIKAMWPTLCGTARQRALAIGERGVALGLWQPNTGPHWMIENTAHRLNLITTPEAA